jgi:hypothetical protein
MSDRPLDILDLATDEPVPAVLRDGLTAIDLVEAEALWSPARFGSIAALLRAGTQARDIPQHHHWNWWLKAGDLADMDTEVFGIHHQDRWQGLMMITSSVSHRARLDGQRGKELVYVKYLESAPWNVAAFTRPMDEPPKFGAIGTRLLEVAVRRSVSLGFRGRVGLHALPNPDTEGFYRRRGMRPLGADPAVENLPYYEYEEAAAQAFLRGGERHG